MHRLRSRFPPRISECFASFTREICARISVRPPFAGCGISISELHGLQLTHLGLMPLPSLMDGTRASTVSSPSMFWCITARRNNQESDDSRASGAIRCLNNRMQTLRCRAAKGRKERRTQLATRQPDRPVRVSSRLVSCSTCSHFKGALGVEQVAEGVERYVARDTAPPRDIRTLCQKCKLRADRSRTENRRRA